MILCYSSQIPGIRAYTTREQSLSRTGIPTQYHGMQMKRISKTNIIDPHHGVPLCNSCGGQVMSRPIGQRLWPGTSVIFHLHVRLFFITGFGTETIFVLWRITCKWYLSSFKFLCQVYLL